MKGKSKLKFLKERRAYARITNLVKTFNPGGINKKVALNGINLHLREGDFTTVIGSNGAGKSTLLNAISGVFFVDKGSIHLDNTDLTFMPQHKRAVFIGRVFQDPMLGTASNMTIEENLVVALKRGERRLFKNAINSKLRSYFKEKLRTFDLNLEDRLNQKIGLLSGGQRQALTLLMATLTKPKLLLLDEHTASLDPKTAHKVMDLTTEIVKSITLNRQ